MKERLILNLKPDDRVGLREGDLLTLQMPGYIRLFTVEKILESNTDSSIVKIQVIDTYERIRN